MVIGLIRFLYFYFFLLIKMDNLYKNLLSELKRYSHKDYVNDIISLVNKNPDYLKDHKVLFKSFIADLKDFDDDVLNDLFVDYQIARDCYDLSDSELRALDKDFVSSCGSIDSRLVEFYDTLLDLEHCKGGFFKKVLNFFRMGK